MATPRLVLCCMLLSTLGMCLSAPASRFDQRQEGDINVRAKLDNFIVVLIPTSGATLSDGLLSFLLSMKRAGVREDRVSHDAVLPTAATSGVAASVYVNTLTLDKPDDVVEITYEQVQAALLTPSTLAVPPVMRGVATEQAKKAKAISTTLKSRLKERNLLEERVKLMSEDIEVCAPDQRRDEDGNCEPLTTKHRNEPQAFTGGLTPDILSFGLSPAISD